MILPIRNIVWTWFVFQLEICIIAFVTVQQGKICVNDYWSLHIWYKVVSMVAI